MGMASLRFYRNQYRYPHYSESITAYGSPMDCTPVGMNFKSGVLRVKGDMQDFMSCNYLSFSRDGITLYGWIDDVKFRTEDSFEVSYSIDSWRTYKSKIDLGTQFIARQPQPTTKRDPLLGRSTSYPVKSSYLQTISDSTKRVFVVQVRAATGELPSNTPINPTPYIFYVCDFDITDWTKSTPILNLMGTLTYGAESTNVVTMYSIPYMDISGLMPQVLNVKAGSSSTPIDGFRTLDGYTNPNPLLTKETPIYIGEDIPKMLRVDHSVKIVIPEAGIIDVPDELLVKTDLRLRQDVDIFSGACNYMLVSGTNQYYTQSVRGSSISSVVVTSDAMDTYISQNQNALATSLIGDVATVGGGMAMAASGPVGAAVGATSVISGVNSMISRGAQVLDAGNRQSNPPAFLGTALASHFNQRYWIVIAKMEAENETDVHNQFGYPIDMVGKLNFPTKGFIQTEGCAVISADGSVPRWALDEINTNFNNGILVH
jgi:hypothetical protein